MSEHEFKIGDRVEYIGPVNGVGFGVVDSVNENGSHCIRWLKGGTSAEYAKDIRIAPSVAVAPTLETATGADLDRIAADIGAGPRLHCESDASFRLSTVQYAAWKQRTADVVRALQPPDPGVTQAEWSAAIARINAQHKALDTVRRFLGSHSFASCSLACNRELREVMAVVLAALDAERAGK